MSIWNKKIRSRLMNVVGSFVFGSPDTLRVSKDFYYMASDRQLPAPGQDNPEAQKGRIYTNRVRLFVIRRAFLVAFVFNTVVFLAGAGVVAVTFEVPQVVINLYSLAQRSIPLLPSMPDSIMADQRKQEQVAAIERKFTERGEVEGCRMTASIVAMSPADVAAMPLDRQEIHAAAREVFDKHNCARSK